MIIKNNTRPRWAEEYNTYYGRSDVAVMEVRVVAKVTIAADRPSVFKYLTNLKYHFLWNPHLQSITRLKRLKPGATYESTSLLLGIRVQGTNRVAKFVPDREVELENNTGALHYQVNYQLTGIPRKTLLTCTTTVSSQSQAFAFTKPVLRLLARRELQSDLQALKIAVEQGLE
jgi:uncharacterized protein YndB with AHSA1/START domain